MVICSYCGQENKIGNLKCSNCGKPLSLLSNDSSDPIFEKELNQNHENDFQKGDFQKGIKKNSIKWKYANSQSNQEKKHDNLDIGFNNQNKDYDAPVNNFNYNQNYDDEQYYDDNINTSSEKFEYFIEWDVIIASSLIVIILTAIFNRIFPVVAYIIALIISLIYVLITTKNKNTLMLVIPLSFITTCAMSAFLSL
ncbi:MAG: hypothetical protein LBT66_06290 [Methanobrevibacter sp.]|jgi:hypothetical protein|nr:hypothetical protein [Candidatus Methanovirga meridionalis]